MDESRLKIAHHAYRTVPAYRRLLEKSNMTLDEIMIPHNWIHLPRMEKTDAVMHPGQMISEEYLALLATNRLFRAHTSGSTGTYLDVYWNPDDYRNSLLPLWMERWKTAGIHPRDNVCFFNTVLENDEAYKYDKNKLIISKSNLDEEKLKDIYKKILDFSPKWLLIHPGMATILCDLIEKNQLPAIPSLTYVELTGEMIFDHLKERIKRNLSCIVKGHYGTMEVSTIGYEYGEYYRVYKESTFIEILDQQGNQVKEGEIGNIYVTSLHNHAMPFVRYGIGDYGSLITKEKNGRTETLLKLTSGRKNDWLTLSDGKKIPPDTLLKPIEIINNIYENVIYQFQVTQTAPDKLQLMVVIDPEFQNDEFVLLYKRYLNEPWAQKMHFTFNFQKSIYPDTTTGKVRWFINKCKEEKNI